MVHESSEKNAMRGLKRLAERKKYFSVRRCFDRHGWCHVVAGHNANVSSVEGPIEFQRVDLDRVVMMS